MTKGLNYLITAALAATVWVALGMFIGQPFADRLTLAMTTPEDFLVFFQVMLGIGTLISIGIIYYWYYYGNKDSTATRLSEAKSKWNLFFILEILLSLILVITMVWKYKAEGVAASDWIILFLFFTVPTFILFWFTTYFMSPRAVTYIPLLKR